MKLLDKDPAQRLSANQALQHAWFQSSKEKVIAKNSDFLNNLSNYYVLASLIQRENNLISVLESYLVFSKVSQDERKRISLLFKQLDRNHDGIIQKNELIQAYKEANSG
jgi:serine/threonine protein kinase